MVMEGAMTVWEGAKCDSSGRTKDSSTWPVVVRVFNI